MQFFKLYNHKLIIFPLGPYLLQFTDWKLLNGELFGIFSLILFVQVMIQCFIYHTLIKSVIKTELAFFLRSFCHDYQTPTSTALFSDVAGQHYLYFADAEQKQSKIKPWRIGQLRLVVSQILHSLLQNAHLITKGGISVSQISGRLCGENVMLAQLNSSFWCIHKRTGQT